MGVFEVGEDLSQAFTCPYIPMNHSPSGCIVILGGAVIICGVDEGVVERTTLRAHQSWGVS